MSEGHEVWGLARCSGTAWQGVLGVRDGFEELPAKPRLTAHWPGEGVVGEDLVFQAQKTWAKDRGRDRA